MKRITVILMVLLSSSLCVQEEFFGNESEISTGYIYSMQDFRTDYDVHSLRLTFYLKNGLSLSVLENISGENSVPSLGISYLSQAKEQNSYARVFGSFSHYSTLNIKYFGFSGGVVQCFNMTKDFPTSLHGNISLNLSTTSGLGDLETKGTTLGLGVGQAFYAHNKIYPFVSAVI